MGIKITHDANAPTAAVELAIKKALPGYDIDEVDLPVPREVDGVLVTQGFKDLVDDARSIVEGLVAGKGLEIAQLTGAICPDGRFFRPGLWLVLRETGASAGQAMSPLTRQRVAAIAEELRTCLQLS